MGDQDEAIRRIEGVEKRLDKIEQEITEQSKTDLMLKSELQAVRSEFFSMKEDVLSTIRDHTNKTWSLIEKGGKIIMWLIIVIVALAGLKLGPEIIKSLTAQGTGQLQFAGRDIYGSQMFIQRGSASIANPRAE